jgi:hypothetical protein
MLMAINVPDVHWSDGSSFKAAGSMGMKEMVWQVSNWSLIGRSTARYASGLAAISDLAYSCQSTEELRRRYDAKRLVI